MDQSKINYHYTVSASGGRSGYPILECPICKKYKVNMYTHSKSKKCSFDYKKTYPQLFEKKTND